MVSTLSVGSLFNQRHGSAIRGRKGIFVGVAPQAVTDWFAGRQQPTAEQIWNVQEFLKNLRKSKPQGWRTVAARVKL